MFTYFLYFSVIISLSLPLLKGAAKFDESSFPLSLAYLGLMICYISLFIYPMLKKHSKKLSLAFFASFILIWLYYGVYFVHMIYDAIQGNLHLSLLEGWTLPGEPINPLPGILLLMSSWHSYMGAVMKEDPLLERKFYAPMKGSWILLPYLLSFLTIFFFGFFYFWQACTNIPAH